MDSVLHSGCENIGKSNPISARYRNICNMRCLDVWIIYCAGLIFVVFYFDNQKNGFIFVKRRISADVNP